MQPFIVQSSPIQPNVHSALALPLYRSLCFLTLFVYLDNATYASPKTNSQINQQLQQTNLVNVKERPIQTVSRRVVYHGKTPSFRWSVQDSILFLRQVALTELNKSATPFRNFVVKSANGNKVAAYRRAAYLGSVDFSSTYGMLHSQTAISRLKPLNVGKERDWIENRKFIVSTPSVAQTVANNQSNLYLVQLPTSLQSALPTATANPTPAPPVTLSPTVTPAPIARDAQGVPLVNNVFADSDIKQALSDISAQTGVPIVADNTVQGNVTIEFKDVPLERALTMISQAGGFSFTKLDGYYLVGVPDANNPNFYLLTTTEVVKLKNITPAAALNLLALPYGRYLSTEGYVPPVPERSNNNDANFSRRVQGSGSLGGLQTPASTSSSVFSPALPNRVSITAPRYMLERIKADIARIDRPRTQVMLEAVVLEVSQSALKDVGINFATRWIRSNLGTGGANVSYSSIANTELVQLTALVQRGAARLRANPRVATAEGQTAELEVGRENYFSLTSGTVQFAYNTIEAIRSGILLRITPTVLEDEDEVMARIEPEVRDVTGRTLNGLPEITFRRAATNLRVRNGQSIVIGGLINESTIKNNTKIPILGDIPIIGRAFRGVNTSQNMTETVIVITPRIMTDDKQVDGIRSPLLKQDIIDLRGDKPFAGLNTPK